jgi:hypothetical protein
VIAAVPLVCGVVLCLVVWAIRGFGVEEPSLDLEDLQRDWVARIQTQAPDFYREEVEPQLDSWRAKYGSRVPTRELLMMQQRNHEKMARIAQERQEIIDRAAKDGKRVEIATLRQNIERAITEEHQGPDRDQCIKQLDTWLKSLEAEYGTSIPIDEAHRMMERLESGTGDELP